MTNIKLPNVYISGLVDGEGCFSLNYRKNIKQFKKTEKIYYEWKTCFAIVLRTDDTNLLKNIQSTLSVGRLYLGRRLSQLRVQNLNDLHDVIIPFFKKNKLFGKKMKDFNLWSEAVEILYNHKQNGTKIIKGVRGFKEKVWDKDELNRLNKIRKLMKKYKSERIKDFKYVPDYSNLK